MNDVGTFNGDILIVDRSLQHEHMNVVVTTYNGSVSCKIYYDINKRLLSASSDYPPNDIDSNGSLIIEGVVTSSSKYGSYQYSIRCHTPNRFSNSMRLIRFSSSLIFIYSGVNADGWSATLFRSFFNCRAHL